MSSKDIYCTYLITYSGDKLPPKYKNSSIKPTKYIGSGITTDILSKRYLGSVASKQYGKIWKSETKSNSELFYPFIIETFDTRDNALEAEEIEQRKANAVKSEEYVNMSYARKKFGGTLSEETKKEVSERSKKSKHWWNPVTNHTTFCEFPPDENYINKRPPESEETRRKKSIASSKRVHSEETKERQRIAAKNRPPITEETRELIRVANTGKTLSKESIKKRQLKKAGSIWWHNPDTNKEKSSILSPGEDYIKGRAPFKENRKIECPHCNKQGKGGAMVRWHFDNCKMK
jgi:hypothetical protein